MFMTRKMNVGKVMSLKLWKPNQLVKISVGDWFKLLKKLNK